ncbi:MAG: hypothetical protein J6T07_00365, partial [Bacteroidales bacterium]|nr:hypothetical protein [Bacteroidales bacterium]
YAFAGVEALQRAPAGVGVQMRSGRAARGWRVAGMMMRRRRRRRRWEGLDLSVICNGLAQWGLRKVVLPIFDVLIYLSYWK